MSDPDNLPPAPNFAQREAIAEARARVGFAVERKTVNAAEAATAWRDYSALCAAHGLRTPPPWQQWPTGPTESLAHRRERITPQTPGQSGPATQGDSRMTEQYVTPPTRGRGTPAVGRGRPLPRPRPESQHRHCPRHGKPASCATSWPMVLAGGHGVDGPRGKRMGFEEAALINRGR